MTTPPFKRDVDVGEPAIVGARWWNQSVKAATTRRQVLTAFILGGAGLAVGSAIVSIARAAGPNVRYEPRGALDMQRDYGWSFGAEGLALEFPIGSELALPASTFDGLVAALEPKRAAHHPHYVPTLFEAPPAVPRKPRPTDAAIAGPFKDSAKGYQNLLNDRDYRCGQKLAAKLKDKPGVGVIVDLLGPASVAFAAGAAEVFDPIFLVDNWPHPKGVVPAHTTIGAVARYRDRFESTRDGRGDAPPPLFVLDRARLAPYVDDASTFDNRHLAKLPSVADLKRLGITELVYVAPSAADIELDDLNDALVEAKGSFALFATAPGQLDAGVDPEKTPFSPVPRVTPFSRGGARPAGFGTVPVAIAIATGIIVGAKMHRMGSWNRSDGSSFGGG